MYGESTSQGQVVLRHKCGWSPGGYLLLTTEWGFILGGEKPTSVPPFTASCKTLLLVKKHQYLPLLGKGVLLSLEQIHLSTSGLRGAGHKSTPLSSLTAFWKRLLLSPLTALGNHIPVQRELGEQLFTILPSSGAAPPTQIRLN